VLVAGVVTVAGLDTHNTFTQVLAYLAGGAAVAGTAALLMAALLTVMHRVAPAGEPTDEPAVAPAGDEQPVASAGG
jgi:hypothetical protein